MGATGGTDDLHSTGRVSR